MKSLSQTFLFVTYISACIACPDISRRYKRAASENATWSYTGSTGPLLWAALDATNSACAKGDSQSPVNIPSDKMPTAKISVTFPARIYNATLLNNGHTVQVIPPVDGKVSNKFDGKWYNLQQFHFHTPSEHRVDLEYYPVEIHFVYQLRGGTATVVLAAFFELDTAPPTRFLDAITNCITSVRGTNDKKQLSYVPMREISYAFNSRPVFTYTGSLTTPPCTESVPWYIIRRPLRMSVGQFRAMKSVLKFNSQYTQNDFVAPGLPRENLLMLAAATSQ